MSRVVLRFQISRLFLDFGLDLQMWGLVVLVTFTRGPRIALMVGPLMFGAAVGGAPEEPTAALRVVK